VLPEGGALTNRYIYDQQFNTLRITDARGRAVESYVLDIQDRPATVTNLEGQTMTVSYGVAEYVKSLCRFDGTVVTNEPDSDGRLWRVHCADTTNTFGYLRNDLLRAAGNEAGIISNAYNAANQLTETVGVSPGGAVSYTYWPAGQVSNVTSAAGDCAYSYDGAERVTAIESPEGGFLYTYDPNNGLVAEVAFTNSGMTACYDYDVMDRVTSITWRDSVGSALRSLAYEYNDAGMVTEVKCGDGKRRRFQYDGLDRLTGETGWDASGRCVTNETYAYDEVGNRIRKQGEYSSVSYTYPYGTAGNRLSEYSVSVETPRPRGSLFVLDGRGTGGAVRGRTVQAATNAYLYDAAGCITTVVSSASTTDSTLRLKWNNLYQLTSVVEDGVPAESYAYDALGRRVAVSAGAAATHLIYDGIHVVAEVDADGSLTRSYTYGPGIDSILAMTSHGPTSTNVYYFMTDHLGSVHAVTDASGTIVESYEYDAWGRVLGVYDGAGKELDCSAVGNRFLWQGREYSWPIHVATGGNGLYFFRARWYDPNTGRWLSKDPIGIAGGLNQYVFCGNNPINFRDPWGLWNVELGGGWGIAGKIVLGHNSGRWTLNITGGLGAGLMGSLDTDDTGFGHVSEGFGIGIQVLAEASGELGPLASLGGAARLYADADTCDNAEGGWEVFGNANALSRSQIRGLRGVLRSNPRQAKVDPVIEPFRSDSVGGGGLIFGGIGARLSW